jgi:putative ABC transport system permease protein
MSQIGIQKALGAPEYIIMTQFLSEAGALSIIGGGLGILIVVIISLILGSDSQVPFELTIYNVTGGMGMAFVTGILSGAMPAWSAAKMDPVKAMNSNTI